MKLKQNRGWVLAVLLLLLSLSLVSAAVLVQANWLVDGKAVSGKSLTTEVGKTVSFAVFVNTNEDGEPWLEVLMENTATKKVSEPDVKAKLASVNADTYTFIVDYTPKEAGTFKLVTVAHTITNSDSDELTLKVNPKPQPQPTEVLGCTDKTATNYNPDATKDDGSCTYPQPACADGDKDGICDTTDACPKDKYNDADKDGICGDVDLCPYNKGVKEKNGCINNVPTLTFDPAPDTTGPYGIYVYYLTPGENPTIKLTGKDLDGDKLKLTLADGNLPQEHPFIDHKDNTASFTLIANEAGNYWATFKVSDGIDSNTEYVAFIVQEEEVTPPVNNAPIMNDVAPQTVIEGGQLTFNVGATDAEGDKLTFQAKKAEPECKNSWCKAFDAIKDTVETFFGYYLPDYVDFNENTGTFTLSPGFKIVKHPDITKTVKFEVRASDGKAYSGWEKVEVAITDVNQLPVLTYTEDHFEEGKKVSIAVEASDADSEDVLALSVFTVPKWATFTIAGNKVVIEGVPGCDDAKDYSFTVKVDDGFTEVYKTIKFTVSEACNVDVPGCTDEKATNYNPEATVDDGSCTYPPVEVLGCTNPAATNYNSSATKDDDSCIFPPTEVPGCMEKEATNYNPLATVDDGSCTFSQPTEVLGCTDKTATNYNPLATKDDGSCTFAPSPVVVFGCTDKNALNYYIQATNDDGSCQYPQPGKKVYFQKVHLVSDAVSSGDAAFFSVTVANGGEVDLENLKVTAVVYELGAKKSTGGFELDSGDSKNLNLVLPIPYDAEAGDYLIKVTVGNDDFHDTTFREFSVMESSW